MKLILKERSTKIFPPPSNLYTVWSNRENKKLTRLCMRLFDWHKGLWYIAGTIGRLFFCINEVDSS